MITTPVKTIRILLADDHTLMRAGIRSLLEKMDSIVVVAEASDGREALELIREHLPEVVLMDLAMPGLNGLEAVIRTSREFPTVKVIVLSMHRNMEYVVQALRGGARGYLLKDAATSELNIAIKAVAANGIYLSPRISQSVIDEYLKRVENHSSRRNLLTPRQREIVQLIAEGRSAKDIAFMLKLSVKTVDAHRSQLMNRLEIHDVPGLVRYAIRSGLVPPETVPNEFA